MGINFDILSDSLLNEDSDFSKFFNTEEPIRLIHKALKVSADTQLVLSPTNNRHVLWDELKRGKAIFASKNQSELVAKSLDEFKNEINKLRPPPNRAQSFNEIKYLILSHFGAMATKGKITSKEYQKIQERIRGPIAASIKALFPKDVKRLMDILDAFLSGIRPGDQILVKRLAHNPSTEVEKQYLAPGERQFPMAKKPDEMKYLPGTKEKIFHQEYIAWFFDGDTLVNKKAYNVNGITVYRDLFAGWADINFYVIENEKFLKAQTHPYVSTQENQFSKIIPLDQQNITAFVTSTLNKYEKVIMNKIQANASGIGQDEPGYEEAMSIIHNGIKGINPTQLFKDFILKDITHKLSDYMIIQSDIPKNPNMPWTKDNAQQGNLKSPSKEWKSLDVDAAIEKIQGMMRTDLPTKQTEMVTVRLKTDRSKSQKVDPVTLMRTPGATDKYEMFDANTSNWVPFDPNYIKSYTSNYGPKGNLAVAFATPQDATNFARIFALYAMRNVVKAPENKQIEDILGLL